MKTTEYLTSTIDKLPKGYVFTFSNFNIQPDQTEAVIKALNRMVQTGQLAKLSKGRYYKPENTPFGPLLPDIREVVKDLLEDNGKIIGYLTGYSIYNQLGLTTQVSNTIQIGKNDIRPTFKRERYTISFIRQKNTITKETVPLLQLLDTMRYIKKIPDTDLQTSTKRLLDILKDLAEDEQKTLVRLSLKYPPATRALLGAMLDKLGKEIFTSALSKSLNPITTYKLPGIGNILRTATNWHIV
ncbi:DUF6088 family protein [Spirosoma linguale]